MYKNEVIIRVELNTTEGFKKLIEKQHGDLAEYFRFQLNEKLGEIKKAYWEHEGNPFIALVDVQS